MSGDVERAEHYWEQWQARAEAAEAEVQRLREACTDFENAYVGEREGKVTAEARVRAAEALADEWESDRDVCLAWIADPKMHVDPGHPMRLSGVADLLNRHAECVRVAIATPAPVAVGVEVKQRTLATLAGPSLAAAPPTLDGAFRQLARLVEVTADLDYSPFDAAWVCGAHGLPDCVQGDCSKLPWPEPTGDQMLAAFMDWADGEFRRNMRPYHESNDPDRDMPDDAYLCYTVGEWPASAFSAAAKRLAAAVARDGDRLAGPSRCCGGAGG